MNDYAIDPATNIDVRKQIAFVSQDDALAFTATPREAAASFSKSQKAGSRLIDV